jgi:hypothetical protein
MTLWLDFETRSACDLKAAGVYNYAQDPSTDVLCMSWAFDDEELASVVDSRHVITLYKAMQYDKLQKSKPGINKKLAEAPKVMKSGVSQPRDTNSEQVKKLKAKARATGRVADAAALFERFI